MMFCRSDKKQYPLPNDLQDIVLSYLPKDEQEMIKEFKAYTLSVGESLLGWPVMLTAVAFVHNSAPSRVKIPLRVVGPISVVAAAGLTLAASTVTVPADISRCVYHKISHEKAKHKDKNQASFFVDVKRQPKNIPRINEQRGIKTP